MKLSVIAAALASVVGLCECSTKMVIGYFPNWLYANYPVENIPFEKYTHINYAFALLNNPDHLPSFPDDLTVESSLPKLISLAHGNNTKVLLSIGGWTGSQLFSTMAADKDKRKKFIEWNLDFIEKYKTDGVDIDWEYPGKQAAGCNELSENDADNLLQLLKELRQELDKNYPKGRKEISMAVHVKPFIKSGTPMTNVTEFVPYFDHINLMSYDINGVWASKTGPNAPFKAQQGRGAQFSFFDSINDWKKAGVPSSKMTAGLAFYGRTIQAETDMTKDPHQYHNAIVGAPKGDSDDEYWKNPYCSKDVAGLSGIWKWTNLRKEGILNDDMVTTSQGWTRYWDDVTKTPWLFNPSTKHYISYDDPTSIDIKVQHSLCEGLAGVMVWDIHHDNGELVEVANRIHDPVPEKCSSPDFYLTSHYRKQKIVEKVMKKDQKNKDDDDDDDDDDDNGEDYLASSQYVSPIKATEKNGDPCFVSGEEKCVQSGASSQWLTCNINKWIIRDCSYGLVCHDSEGILYCDFPPRATSTMSSIRSATSTTTAKFSSSNTVSNNKSSSSATSSFVNKTSSLTNSLLPPSITEVSSTDLSSTKSPVVESSPFGTSSIGNSSITESSFIETSSPESSSSESSSVETSSDDPSSFATSSTEISSIIESSSSEPSSSKSSSPKTFFTESSFIEMSSSESSSSVESSAESSVVETPFFEISTLESSSIGSSSAESSSPETSSNIISSVETSSLEPKPVFEEPIPTTDEFVQALEETLPESEDLKFDSEENIQDPDEPSEKLIEVKPDFDKIILGSEEPLPDLEELISNFEKNQPINYDNIEDEHLAPVENEPIANGEMSEKPIAEENIEKTIPLVEPVGPIPIAKPIDSNAQNLENW